MDVSNAPRILIALGASLVFVALVLGGPGSAGGPGSEATLAAASSLAPLVFVNAYGRRIAGDSVYPTFSDAALVEPFRPTTILVRAADGDIDEALASFSVSRARGAAGGAPAVARVDGAWSVQFEAVGNYALTATAPGFAARTEKVTCRYVRRNLRKLTDADRGLYFDAFKTLMTVPTDRGARAFGDAYADLDSFVAVHLNLGGARENDALHDGMGFVTAHTALTLAFEASLQTVAPATSVPFWDFTEDWHLAAASPGAELEALWSLDVWGDDWFGTAAGPYHTVETGRFAYVRIPPAPANATWKSPYGFLRSPWNCNKDPFLMRSHSFCGANYDWLEGSLTIDANPINTAWPSCKVHHELTFETSSLYDWVWNAAYTPHGPVHFMIGGYTHCGDMEANLAPDAKGARNLSAIVGNVKQQAVAFPKTLWRYGLVEYPRHCSADTPQAECHMVCAHPVDVAPFRDYLLAGDMGAHMFGPWLSDFPEELWTDFLEVICTTPFSPGEQMGANSPVDPSFWPIHPTLDRLLTYKRLVEPFLDANWTNPRAPDQRTQYCISDNGNTVTRCKGHHAYDLVPWQVHRLGPDGTFDADPSFVTNGELFDLSDPRDYRLPYVYDDFAWPHCVQAGYAFPAPQNDRPAPPAPRETRPAPPGA